MSDTQDTQDNDNETPAPPQTPQEETPYNILFDDDMGASDNENTSTNTNNVTIPRLRGHMDLEKWFQRITIEAKRLSIWKYINPDGAKVDAETSPEYIEAPDPPDIGDDDNVNNRLKDKYKYKLDAYNRYSRAFSRID
jgi:hypothetical protein